MCYCPKFVELRLDHVCQCLESYVERAIGMQVDGDLKGKAEAAIVELKKVIRYRGDVLFIQERVKRRREYYLGLGYASYEKPALNSF